MQITDVDKWPPALQYAAFIGAIVAAAIMWLRGWLRGPASDTESDDLRRRLEIMEIEKTLAKIVEAQRISFDVKLKEIEDRYDAEIENMRRDLYRIELDIARRNGTHRHT